MKTYIFTNAEGKKGSANVQDSVYGVLTELDKQEHLDELRETRRCQSLEASMENGFDIVDDTADIDVILDKKERYKALYSALAKLPAKQRELIQKVFFEGISQTEIASQQGITKMALHNKLTRILRNLKKLLQ